MKQKLFQHLKHAQKLEGIHIEPDEKDTNRFYAMIIGGIDTPYQHGFYMFTFDFTRDYPTYPPEVTFHNTNIVNRGRVHPNCYQSALKGKVCLSLIGTWGKNTWNPNTSSFGEILLNLKAIILVNDPLQNGEPPYMHSLYLRDSYTYSVKVLNMMDYFLGTYIKMMDNTYNDKFIEPFKDIIMNYVQDEDNKKSFIRMYNDLVLSTKINMKNECVIADGRFIQSFYQIGMSCNLNKLKKMFYEVIRPDETDDILPNDFEFGDFNPNKCHWIVYPKNPKAHQCPCKQSKGFFCGAHSKKISDDIKLCDTPLMCKVLGKSLSHKLPASKEPVASQEPVALNKMKCHALTAKGIQCSCKIKFGNFCGMHKNTQKHGVMT